jgi:hypothetical protein
VYSAEDSKDSDESEEMDLDETDSDFEPPVEGRRKSRSQTKKPAKKGKTTKKNPNLRFLIFCNS